MFDEEGIPPMNQGEDYDATEATSTLHLRQKLKQDKRVSLYRYIEGNKH